MSVSLIVEPSCHTTLAQRDEIVRGNPRVVETAAVSVLVEKVSVRRYNLRKLLK